MPEITIVTISTNELHFLKGMLASLYRHEDSARFEVILVDNASKDGTSEYIRENYPGIFVLRNRKKQGFAFNNNIGMRRAKGDFILVLNPDTVFTEPLLSEMIGYMRSNPDIGLCACKLMNKDMTVQQSVRRYYTYLTLLVRRFPFFRPFLLASQINRHHLYEERGKNRVFFPDWILGAFMMFPKKLLDSVGFFDERFKLYFEDVDLCRRIWHSGLKVCYYPKRSIIHLYNRESDTKRFIKGFKLQKGAKMHLKSMLRYILKYRLSLGEKHG